MLVIWGSLGASLTKDHVLRWGPTGRLHHRRPQSRAMGFVETGYPPTCLGIHFGATIWEAPSSGHGFQIQSSAHLSGAVLGGYSFGCYMSGHGPWI